MSMGEEYLADHAYEMQYNECVCGTCRWNRRDWTNPNNPDFYCGNENSDAYGYNTMYADVCDEWEEK